jgi:hypothetical protein
MRIGNKKIFHLEAWVVKVMSIYKVRLRVCYCVCIFNVCVVALLVVFCPPWFLYYLPLAVCSPFTLILLANYITDTLVSDSISSTEWIWTTLSDDATASLMPVFLWFVRLSRMSAV